MVGCIWINSAAILTHFKKELEEGKKKHHAKFGVDVFLMLLKMTNPVYLFLTLDTVSYSKCCLSLFSSCLIYFLMRKRLLSTPFCRKKSS